MKTIAMAILALATGCTDPLYGGKDSNTGDTGSGTETETDSGTTGGTDSNTSEYPVTTKITLNEGHYHVNSGGIWTDLWLDGTDGEYSDQDADTGTAGFQVIGDPDNGGGWFFVNADDSQYSIDYTINSGFRVELSCDDESYDYCWNGGSATLEVFGVSGYPQ